LEEKQLPFIFLYPLLETSLEIVNLFGCDFEIKANHKKLDQKHKVLIISLVYEPAFKKHGCEIQRPD